MSKKTEAGKAVTDYTKYDSTDLTVRLIEFFVLGAEPDQAKGDWDSSFSVFNYFIPGASILSINDQIFNCGGRVVFSQHEVKEFLEVALSEKIKKDGSSVSGDVLFGLVQAAISGENDVDVVVDFFGEKSIEVFEGTDELSPDLSNTFGCRIWSFDIEGGRVVGSGSSWHLDLSASDSKNLDEFLQNHEEEAIKSIVIIKNIRTDVGSSIQSQSHQNVPQNFNKYKELLDQAREKSICFYYQKVFRSMIDDHFDDLGAIKQAFIESYPTIVTIDQKKTMKSYAKELIKDKVLLKAITKEIDQL